MRETDTERHLARLGNELWSRAAGAATEAEIQHVLQEALRDLKGSVSDASLPEMAARLATARLDATRHKVLTTA